MRDDTTYFYDRAETELELAQRATHPLAVRAHYIIANHYLDRCYGGAPDAPAAEASPTAADPVPPTGADPDAAPFVDAPDEGDHDGRGRHERLER